MLAVRFLLLKMSQWGRPQCDIFDKNIGNYLVCIHIFTIFAVGKARIYPKTIIPCRISWCIGHQSSMSCVTTYTIKCIALSS